MDDELDMPVARSNNTIFLRAKQTGQRQFLGKYDELCNDATEECNLDHVYVYILPSGEFEEVRIHTWRNDKRYDY